MIVTITQINTIQIIEKYIDMSIKTNQKYETYNYSSHTLYAHDYGIKPHDQLVLVRLICYRPSTPSRSIS